MSDNPTTNKVDQVLSGMKGNLSQKLIEDANGHLDGIMGAAYKEKKAASTDKDGLTKSQLAYIGARDHVFGSDPRDVDAKHAAKPASVELSDRDKQLVKAGFLAERTNSLGDGQPLSPATSSANLDRVLGQLKSGKDVGQVLNDTDSLLNANFQAAKAGMTDAQVKDLRASEMSFLNARDHFFGTDPRDEKLGKAHKDGTLVVDNARDAQLIKLGFTAARVLELDKK